MIVNGSGKELARKGPKDYVGELALLKNEPRAASVRTVSPHHGSFPQQVRRQSDSRQLGLSLALIATVHVSAWHW